jgi:hypothetical protein
MSDPMVEVVDENDNTVTILLTLVLGGLLLFIVGNTVLWYWAQGQKVPAPKKKVGAKKMKREKLKMGMAPAGE